jgi:hypothetical protein
VRANVSAYGKFLAFPHTDDRPALRGSAEFLLEPCAGIMKAEAGRSLIESVGMAVPYVSANVFRRTVMDTATDSTGSPCPSLTRTQISGLRRLGRLSWPISDAAWMAT